MRASRIVARSLFARSFFARSLLACALITALAACSDDSLSTKGLGFLRIGMTIEEVDAALEENVREAVGAEARTCIVMRASAYPGAYLMLMDGALQRIDIREGEIATDTGVRIGDPVEKVHTVYDSVEVLPHKYEWEAGAQYLTIYDHPNAAAIRFNTAKGKIASFQAGRLEPVLFVEGCG